MKMRQILQGPGLTIYLQKKNIWRLFVLPVLQKKAICTNTKLLSSQ